MDVKRTYLEHCFKPKRVGKEYVLEFDMLRTKEIILAQEWCAEVFGPGGRNSKYRWRYGWLRADSNDHLFYFKHLSDATLFILKWK